MMEHFMRKSSLSNSSVNWRFNLDFKDMIFKKAELLTKLEYIMDEAENTSWQHSGQNLPMH